MVVIQGDLLFEFYFIFGGRRLGLVLLELFVQLISILILAMLLLLVLSLLVLLILFLAINL